MSLVTVLARISPQGVVGSVGGVEGTGRNRHAALVAMAQIADGCVKGMLKDVNGAIAPCVQAATSDPHARVRWAAVNGIGQLCTDLGPKMQEKAHAQVLPALLGAMEDPSHRVQAHSAAAMVHFSEQCPPEHMEPYVDQLMNKRMTMRPGRARVVQEAALTALKPMGALGWPASRAVALSQLHMRL